MIPVLFLAYHFPPAGGAGVQRSQKFVRYLPAQGFQPIVVTGPGPTEDRWTPSDALLMNEIPAGTKVARVKGPLPQRANRWRDRLNRWVGGSPFNSWWIESGNRAALDVIDGARLIFATMSPFSTAVMAQKLSERSGLPWIADLRDPWALDEMLLYPSRLHRIAEIRRMRRQLSSASGIIMNTPEASKVLVEEFEEFRHKLVVTITNGYDAADFEGLVPPRTDGKFRIVHTGYLHTEGGLKQKQTEKIRRFFGGMAGGVDILTRSHVFLLKGVEQWLGKHPAAREDLEIVFAGITSEQDKTAVLESGVAKFVRFPGYLSHRDSVQMVRTADLLFLPMHNLIAGRRSRIVPGKTYEYIASGRPILAAVPDGDARDFLRQAGTAVITAPNDVDAMAGELHRIHEAWKNGVQLAEVDPEFIRKFDRVNLTKNLASLFEEVLKISVRK
jgi:glycosyltransferase involved in cell wall biosynthesis